MTKPPMFPSPSRGLPRGVQYLHRARMFKDSTIGAVAYTNAEQNWPKYALLLQSIELSLKSYCYHCFEHGQIKQRRSNHDLPAWYEFACHCGLTPMPDLKAKLDQLKPDYMDARYPENNSVPELAGLADEAAEEIIAAVSPLISGR